MLTTAPLISAVDTENIVNLTSENIFENSTVNTPLDTPLVTYETDADIVFVENENQLLTAIYNAPPVTECIIALTDHIALSNNTALKIPPNKMVVLMSYNIQNDEIYQLTGAPNYDTITVDGVLTITNITVTHTKKHVGRGVTVNAGGTLIMIDGEISSNQASYGGGVYVSSYGTFTLTGGKISQNNAPFSRGKIGNGGGVHVASNAVFDMLGGLISSNNASQGGGVYNNGVSTFSGGTILDNTAKTEGGGVYNNDNSSFSMLQESVISNNTAFLSGGGIFNNIRSLFTLDSGVISNNLAQRGGGIYNSDAALVTLYGGAVLDNLATEGGGIYNCGVLTLANDEGEISGNNATVGGGVYTSENGIFTFSYGKIVDNNALQNGGGVCNNGIFNMINGTVANNAALNGAGGGIYNTKTFTLHYGKISNNNAQKGGGIYTADTLTINNGALSNNEALLGGGIYIDKFARTCTLRGGTLSNNNALQNGGAIYLTNTAHQIADAADNDSDYIEVDEFKKLFIFESVTFSNNHAATAHNRDTIHDEVYAAQINSNVVWSTPFKQGYNNYDIGYTFGVELFLVPIETVHVYSNYGTETRYTNLFYGQHNLHDLYQTVLESDGRTFTVSNITMEKLYTITYKPDNMSTGIGIIDYAPVGSHYSLKLYNETNIQCKDPTGTFIGWTLKQTTTATSTTSSTVVSDKDSLPVFLRHSASNPHSTIIINNNIILYSTWHVPTNNTSLNNNNNGNDSYGNANASYGSDKTRSFWSGFDFGAIKFDNKAISLFPNGAALFNKNNTADVDVIKDNSNDADADDGAVTLFSENSGAPLFYDFEYGYFYNITIFYDLPNRTLNVANSCNDTQNSDIATCVEGDLVTVSAGNRPGYTFNGWQINSENIYLENPLNATATFTMPAYDVFITATWTPTQYNLTYNLNGGTKTVKMPATYTVSQQPLRIAKPIRPGYTFYGWAIKHINNDNTVDGDSNVVEVTISYNIPANVYGDLELTALWLCNIDKENSFYTITYDGNDHINGAVPIDSRNPYPGSSTVLVLNPKGLFRENYVFIGWDASPDAEKPQYPVGSTFPIQNNVTLYAVWQLVS